jgi:hypothetical protein
MPFIKGRGDISFSMHMTNRLHSGIFGYINYLVEKDRKFILDTLVNGAWQPHGFGRPEYLLIIY